MFQTQLEQIDVWTWTWVHLPLPQVNFLHSQLWGILTVTAYIYPNALTWILWFCDQNVIVLNLFNFQALCNNFVTELHVQSAMRYFVFSCQQKKKNNPNTDVFPSTGLNNFPHRHEMTKRLLLLVQRMAAEVKRGMHEGRTSVRNWPRSRSRQCPNGGLSAVSQLPLTDGLGSKCHKAGTTF